MPHATAWENPDQDEDEPVSRQELVEYLLLICDLTDTFDEAAWESAAQYIGTETETLQEVVRRARQKLEEDHAAMTADDPVDAPAADQDEEDTPTGQEQGEDNEESKN